MLSFYLAALDSEDDRRLFRQLYDRHHGAMERRALAILGSQADAEDAMHSAFVQVIRHFEKIYEIPCEKWEAWLIVIVKNEALMLLRRRRNTLPLEDWDGFVRAAEDVTGCSDLLAVFRTLPESYRAVLEMKALLGYSDREIAQRLGISETAVSTRASRGRSLLKKLLEQEGMTP